MADELVVEFLNWLTDGGRMGLGYRASEGQADVLWLGDRQVSRSELARIVRRWPGGGDLTPESAAALVGLALDKVATSAGREWQLV